VLSSKKKQYVSILKQDKQLTLHYEILQDKKIFKNEESTFLITDENMPRDALFKLDSLQKNISHTYLSSVFEGENQKIIPTSEIDVIGYESIKLNNNSSIVIPKNEIISAVRYFSSSGIDYLISPFSILNEYIQDSGIKNSLNVLIYNNVVYVIIIDNLKEIIFSEVKTLSSFEEIQDKDFSQDVIVGQKVYDEVHFLEIQQFLNEVVEKYYDKNEDIDFLDKVDILYTLKPLNDDQINSLYETMMIEIKYKSINIEEYLHDISIKQNVQSFSFADARVKKESGNLFIWVLFAIVSMIIVTGVLYYKTETTNKQDMQVENNNNIEKKVKAKQLVKKVKPITLASMPNHSVANKNMTETIYMLFDAVPYNAILKDLDIIENGSTYVTNFVINNISLGDMQSKLLNIYKDSKVLLEHKNKSILNTIIENNTPLSDTRSVNLIQYKKINFISTSEATNYLKSIIIRNSEIQYISKNRSEYLTYDFAIKTLVKTPKELFDMIEFINKQKLSITINYPIKFANLNNGLEISYNMKLNQHNKKQVIPKK